MSSAIKGVELSKKSEAIIRAEYLRKLCGEYRDTLHEQSIDHARTAITIASFKGGPEEQAVTPMMLGGFDNVDRVIRDVIGAIKRIESIEEFIDRLSKLTLEEMLTSDDLLVRRTVLFFNKQLEKRHVN